MLLTKVLEEEKVVLLDNLGRCKMIRLEKKNFLVLIALSIILLLYSCIGEDFIEDFMPPRIEITNAIDSLKIDESHLYTFRYFNNVGMIDSTITVAWQSLSPSIVSIDNNGLATALGLGLAKIVVSATTSTFVSDTVTVIANTKESSEPKVVGLRSGVINSTSNYLLEGDCEIKVENGTLKLIFKSNFKATSALPGLVVYLTNNPSTNNGALEVSAITKFTGAQEFLIEGETDISKYDYVLFYCKPFSVKVGDSKLSD